MKKPAARLLLLPLTLAALIAGTGGAAADGPSRQKVSLDQPVAAPPEAVWAIVGNFQDMSWHPAVTKTEGAGGNEPGATRTLTLAGGGQIVEKLEKYDPQAHSYSYRIEQVDPKVLPVTNYASSIGVAPAPGGGSLVTWKGDFIHGYPNNDPPPGLDDEAAIKAVTGVYQGGLTNLKALAEKPGK